MELSSAHLPDPYWQRFSIGTKNRYLVKNARVHTIRSDAFAARSGRELLEVVIETVTSGEKVTIRDESSRTQSDADLNSECEWSGFRRDCNATLDELLLWKHATRGF